MLLVALALVVLLVVGCVLLFPWRARQAARVTELAARAAEERSALRGQMAAESEERVRAVLGEAVQASTSQFTQFAEQAFARGQDALQVVAEERARSLDQVLVPLRGKLTEVEQRLGELRAERERAGATLGQQLSALRAEQQRLGQETQRLGNALVQPTVAGQWGEMQLRTVIEAAGLVEHTQFELQSSHHTDDGLVRPDAVVRLPGDRVIAIDAKTPLKSRLAPEGEQGDTHAKAVRAHVRALASKRYWQHVQGSLELVVLYLPTEALLSAALQQDSTLFADAMRSRVLLATPTTLTALLASVAYGWRQEKVAASALVIARLGEELCARSRVLVEHMDRLGQRLNGAVDAYNKTATSLDSRVLVTARRIADHAEPSGGSDKVETPRTISVAATTTQRTAA